jgi:DNA-directed RNA polymerase subunit delta
MKLKKMDKDVLREMSMVEVAFEIMKDKRNPYDYYDLVDKVAEVKGMKQEEVQERIANLYTDMNIDGRFHSLGDNRWGLKSWYPLEQAEEEITTPVKARKKAKVADVDDIEVHDDGFEDYEDEYEDLEDELDEISNDEDDEDDNEDDFDDKEELDGLGDADDEDEDLDEEEDEEFK